jgi:hypothetical protein
MSNVTQPLRDEHRELLPHIERLRALADSIGDHLGPLCSTTSIACMNFSPII